MGDPSNVFHRDLRSIIWVVRIFRNRVKIARGLGHGEAITHIARGLVQAPIIHQEIFLENQSFSEYFFF